MTVDGSTIETPAARNLRGLWRGLTARRRRAAARRQPPIAATHVSRPRAIRRGRSARPQRTVRRATRTSSTADPDGNHARLAAALCPIGGGA